MKHHIIKYSDSKFTLCGLSTVIIRCRPRFGTCNLESGHQLLNIFGYQKANHCDAWAEMPSDMISLTDNDDIDDDICNICLKINKNEIA